MLRGERQLCLLKTISAASRLVWYIMRSQGLEPIDETRCDALGRKLYEAIPEQSATINDGTGTMWSMKYNYTSFNAILKVTDPRGVEKHFMYDNLNILLQVWYT